MAKRLPMSERARAAIARTKAARAAIDAFITGKADRIVVSPLELEKEPSMATQAEYAKAWRIRDAVKKQQATPEQVEWLALYEVRAPRGRPRGSKTSNGKKAAPASTPTRAIERATPSAPSPIPDSFVGLEGMIDSRWAIAQLAATVASGIVNPNLLISEDASGIARRSVDVALAIVRDVGLAP